MGTEHPIRHLYPGPHFSSRIAELRSLEKGWCDQELEYGEPIPPVFFDRMRLILDKLAEMGPIYQPAIFAEDDGSLEIVWSRAMIMIKRVRTYVSIFNVPDYWYPYADDEIASVVYDYVKAV